MTVDTSRESRTVRRPGALDDLGWDYVAAPDVANALVALLRSPVRPKLPVYVIGIGRPVPHAELLEAVFAAAP
jgi:nucleoside-diphosphate-sugar epimerase